MSITPWVLHLKIKEIFYGPDVEVIKSMISREVMYSDILQMKLNQETNTLNVFIKMRYYFHVVEFINRLMHILPKMCQSYRQIDYSLSKY